MLLLSELYSQVKESCLPVVAWLYQLRVFLHCLLGENNRDGMEEHPFQQTKLLVVALPGELVACSVSEQEAFWIVGGGG